MTRASFHHTLSHAYPPGRVRNGRTHDLGFLPEASGRLFPQPRRHRQVCERRLYVLSYRLAFPCEGQSQIIRTVVSPLHRCPASAVSARLSRSPS